MASSSDEDFVESVARALEASKLDAIVVGATAAVLQGAPLTTQDVDLLVRRVPRNAAEIAAFQTAARRVRTGRRDESDRVAREVVRREADGTWSRYI